MCKKKKGPAVWLCLWSSLSKRSPNECERIKRPCDTPRAAPVYVSMCQYTSACVSIRQHASAPIKRSCDTQRAAPVDVSIRQYTSACVSIRQNTSEYVIIRHHTSAYISIRQHTSRDETRSSPVRALLQVRFLYFTSLLVSLIYYRIFGLLSPSRNEARR